MKKKLRYSTVTITNCSETNDDFIRLYHIFRLTLSPTMQMREFRLYYYSQKLEFIHVTFAYDGGLIVGFLAAAFYETAINEKLSTIGRSAIGLLEDYQGSVFPKWMLYKKYIRYKLLKPARPLILTAYVANPIVYSMICKYTGIIYPRFTTCVPAKIEAIKKQVLTMSGLQKKEDLPFVVRIRFNVHKGKKLLQRIEQSRNVHVQFFIKQTQLKEQTTLLVLIPVSWLNILFTIALFVKYLPAKPLLNLKKGSLLYFAKSYKKCGEKFTLFLHIPNKQLSDINGNSQ